MLISDWSSDVCSSDLLLFFLKRQLIWVPFLGLAWWALDFPFMRRHSREAIVRKPELALADIDATRRACRRFRDPPVAVMNFVAGTGFTARPDERRVGKEGVSTCRARLSPSQ